MLGIIDPKKGTLRLSRLLILNVATLLILSGLIAWDAILPYPWMPIVVFALFVVNLAVVRRSDWQRLVVSDSRRRAVRLLLLPACVFTPAGIVAIVIWVRKPDLPSTVQAIVAILLVAYIWFILLRLSRSANDPEN